MTKHWKNINITLRFPRNWNSLLLRMSSGGCRSPTQKSIGNLQQNMFLFAAISLSFFRVPSIWSLFGGLSFFVSPWNLVAHWLSTLRSDKQFPLTFSSFVAINIFIFILYILLRLINFKAFHTIVWILPIALGPYQYWRSLFSCSYPEKLYYFELH